MLRYTCLYAISHRSPHSNSQVVDLVGEGGTHLAPWPITYWPKYVSICHTKKKFKLLFIYAQQNEEHIRAKFWYIVIPMHGWHKQWRTNRSSTTWYTMNIMSIPHQLVKRVWWPSKSMWWCHVDFCHMACDSSGTSKPVFTLSRISQLESGVPRGWWLADYKEIKIRSNRYKIH